MRDVLPELMTWWRAGQPVGMGTVVGTWDSAPRPPGAAMLVGPDRTAVGSVSGGCVESDVYALAEEVVEGRAPRLQRYGVSDDDAAAVGLTCGGTVDVFVEQISPATFPELGSVSDDVAAGRPVAVATVVEHPDAAWVGRRLVVRPGDDSPLNSTLGSARADAAVADDVRGLLALGSSELLTYGPDGQRRGLGMRVFAASFAPAPRMLVFGAIDFATAVARVGGFLGYRVTVCDARPVFITQSRFPDADELILDWPHRYLAAEAAAGRIDSRTVICVLTHDPKFDLPVLEVALRLPAVAYVGSMGSRRTSDERRRQLREAGLTAEEIARLSSPIGLDLGARTPEETAISIAAEIVSTRWGGQGQRLADLDGRSITPPSRHPASRPERTTMDLKHDFIVPASLDETWAAFNHLELIIACFPGAMLSSVDGQEFVGSLRVKLGPATLAYSGTGRFVERHLGGRHTLIQASGNEVRGKGTATAKISASFSAAGDSTAVHLSTDLSFTGQPAQFAPGVVEDAADRMVAQFADALAGKFADGLGAEALDADANPTFASALGQGASSSSRTYDYQHPSNSVPTDWDKFIHVAPVALKSVGLPLAGALALFLLVRRLTR